MHLDSRLRSGREPRNARHQKAPGGGGVVGDGGVVGGGAVNTKGSFIKSTESSPIHNALVFTTNSRTITVLLGTRSYWFGKC